MIQELKGNVTRLDFDSFPGYSHHVIPHVVNDVGAWGAGFVLDLSNRWSVTKSSYQATVRDKKFTLGQAKHVKVARNVYVAHCFAQHGFVSQTRSRSLNYIHLRTSLQTVAMFSQGLGTTKLDRILWHVPDMIGCGLAGGSRNRVLDILTRIDADTPCLDINIWSLK